MTTSPSKQQNLTGSKKDFFQSTALSKGFLFQNQQDYDPQNYEIQEVVKRTSKTNHLFLEISDQQQNVKQTPNKSRRKRPSVLASIPKDQPKENLFEENLPINGPISRRGQKSNRKSIQKKMSNQVQKLDDEQLIIHDQIVFSKAIKDVNKQQNTNIQNTVPSRRTLQEKQRTKHQQRRQNLFFQSLDNQMTKKANFDIVLSGQSQQDGEENAQDLNKGNEDKKQSIENEQKQHEQDQNQHKVQSQGQASSQNENGNQPKEQPTNDLNSFRQQPQSIIDNQKLHIKSSLSSDHLLKVLTYPVTKKMLMKTNIIRVPGFLNIYPEYHLYFQADKTFLMSAKRVSRTPCSTFVFSMNKDNFQENSPYYLGKAKGSVIGDQLDIFGAGFSPSGAFQKRVTPRQFLATIIYETRLMQSGLPRNFSVYLKKPQVNYYEHFPEVKMYSDEIPLNLLYQNPDNRDKIILLRNKKPQFIEEKRSYSLNFNGRAVVASVKNFILQNEINFENKESSNNQTQKLSPMLFGKVNDNKFNMDIACPLSPLLAFGVALSSFDEKFFCE